tara:strand:+ start:3189 stop:3452 length:264 start_codon:yes stop_codon:yes gene_type:complete
VNRKPRTTNADKEPSKSLYEPVIVGNWIINDPTNELPTVFGVHNLAKAIENEFKVQQANAATKTQKRKSKPRKGTRKTPPLPSMVEL